MYLVVACVFGFFGGGFHAQRITIITEFIPERHVADVVGISVLCTGVGNLIAAPLGGTDRAAEISKKTFEQ